MHAFPFPCRHWLTGTYTQFAVPYFIYDIYAMFMCHWHKYRVKGHEAASGAAGKRSLRTVTRTYLRKEFLMVVHHLFMVLVCFPVSVVSGGQSGRHVRHLPWGMGGPLSLEAAPQNGHSSPMPSTAALAPGQGRLLLGLHANG